MFELCIGASNSLYHSHFFALFTIFTHLTTTRAHLLASSFSTNHKTVDVVHFHLPAITITLSPVCIFFMIVRYIVINSLFFDFTLYYTTSSAIVAIFLNHMSLSSQATGPNILLPNGASVLSIKATALSAKRTYVPSVLLISFLTLTTTHHCTDHFSIVPLGIAVFTANTTLSHTLAVFDFVPLSTLITFPVFAQELSAMMTLDSCCIIV